MIRLIMLLYMVLLASEKKARNRKIRSLLDYVSSPWKAPLKEPSLPKPEPVVGLRARITPLKELEPEPTTLVGWEARAAVRLQMPSTAAADDFIYIERAPETFDTPIGRTLTEEFIRRDPHRCPSAAVRHLPVNDAAREKLARAAERTCEAPKGRPTPRRPRKVHS